MLDDKTGFKNYDIMIKNDNKLCCDVMGLCAEELHEQHQRCPLLLHQPSVTL